MEGNADAVILDTAAAPANGAATAAAPDGDGTILSAGGDGVPQTAESKAIPAAKSKEAPEAKGKETPAAEAPEGAAPETDWTAALPEGMREIAKEAGSLERLEAALRHGLAHSPVTSAEEIEIPVPEGLVLDDANTGWFKKLAVEQNFSKGQIAALAEAYNAQVLGANKRQFAATEKNLKAFYGEGYREKMAVAEDAARRFDEMSGGSFGKVLQMGLGNHEDFIKTMVVIGEAVSDSTLPGNYSGGTGTEAVSTEQFFTDIFNPK